MTLVILNPSSRNHLSLSTPSETQPYPSHEQLPRLRKTEARTGPTVVPSGPLAGKG